MADQNPFSPDQWLEAQRQYWDAWGRLARQTLGASPGTDQGTDPWTQALEQWRQTVAQAAPPPVTDVYDKLLAAGQTYFKALQGLGGTPGADWGETLNRTLESMQAAFTQDAGKGMRGLTDFWQLPMDTWQRMASLLTPTPGDTLRGLHPERAAAGHWREQLSQFLSIPAVGYSRESQEQFQRLGQLVLDYEKALGDYNAQLGRIGSECVQRLQKQLGEREEPITSGRAFYDLWVDTCEEVYGEAVLTDDYARVYGHLVNALMALKYRGMQIVDEALATMNMPAQREIDTLQERLQELRRQNQTLRCSLEELQDRMEALEAEGHKSQTGQASVSSHQASSSKGSSTKRRSSSAKQSSASKPSKPKE